MFFHYRRVTNSAFPFSTMLNLDIVIVINDYVFTVVVTIVAKITYSFFCLFFMTNSEFRNSSDSVNNKKWTYKKRLKINRERML